MKTVKLIIGIISLVLTCIILFQSCAASIGEALADQGGVSGVFVAILMLIAGIIAIAARKSRGAGIVCLISYAIAGILGITAHGIYKDLIIWGVVCLIFAVIFLIATITFKKQRTSEVQQATDLPELKGETE
jgi:ABC-type multidrug transport system permease subunit